MPYPDKRNGKPTGRWCAKLQVNGKLMFKRFDTFEAAQKAEADWEKRAASGEALEGATARSDPHGIPRTLKALARKAEGSLWRGKAIERSNFQKLDIIVKLVGDIPLEDLTTTTIDTLQGLLVARGVKPSTLNRYYTCLNTLLKWGQDRRGYFPHDLPKFPWEDEEDGRIREITEAEEARLVDLLRSYETRPRWEGSQGADKVADLVTVAIQTGMRRGELLRVQLEHIEDDQVSIWVSKTKKARTVPLEPETAQLLRSLVLQGMPKVHTLRHFWDRAKADMGLSEDEDFVFHACRHTCCTRLIRADVGVVVVQKWMGHKDIKTTLRYTHLNDGDLKEALGRLKVRRKASTVVNFPSKVQAS